MYAPAKDTELAGLVAHIDQQLDALRAAVLGLTEDQAHATPCRSALSVGALVAHAVWVMRGATARITKGPRLGPLTEADYASFAGSTELGREESVAELLGVFDAVREEYLDALRSVDPEAETMEPSAPWRGIDEALPIRWRYYLVHQVEEFARHAGHADILREQLDGTLVPDLEATRAGAPANEFFTPYVPAPGTIAV